MKIKPEQLKRSLAQNESALYWLAGDEPLLLQEAADQVRAHCRSQGFVERQLFHVDKSFAWESFTQALANLSLFAERKLFELRLTSGKLEEAGRRALQAYLDAANPDLMLLVSSPKLESRALATKWFKTLEADCVLVQIWPINRDGLAQWLEQRLLREGIRVEAEALQLLCDRVEGNLLAAMQEIEKLKLLAGPAEEGLSLDVKSVTQLVADSSRYNVYQLVDSALLGEAARALKILGAMKAEGVFPLLVLNAVVRELHSLLPMVEKREQGQGSNAIISAARVWFNRKRAVAAALSRLDSASIRQLLDKARLTDQAIKGMNSLNPWDELSLILLTLAGVSTASTRASLAQRHPVAG